MPRQYSRVHMCDVPPFFYIHVCDVTPLCVLDTNCGNIADMWHDSFIYVTCLVCIVAHIYVMWLIFVFWPQTAVMLLVCDVTSSYMWNASSVLSHAYMWHRSLFFPLPLSLSTSPFFCLCIPVSPSSFLAVHLWRNSTLPDLSEMVTCHGLCRPCNTLQHTPCNTLATHLQHTCNTQLYRKRGCVTEFVDPATHCNAHTATHLQHTCNTLATHLQHSALSKTGICHGICGPCNTLHNTHTATHLQQNWNTLATHLQHSALSKTGICHRICGPCNTLQHTHCSTPTTPL